MNQVSIELALPAWWKIDNTSCENLSYFPQYENDTSINFSGPCFQTFQNVGKYSSGCHGNQVSIFRRWVLTYIMSLPSFKLIGQQTTKLLQGLCFLTFRGLCFQTFQNVGKYSSGCHGNQVSIFRRWVLT